ncbi:UMP-CMP kinase 2, mitochondrial isoform X2 [Choloepus didactylus]|uniref:UMP-CMP kinase 2, mitochondrial isoform X2 n=1 Tax=Choloepus didactylus TaxID=27675 RepID=UPI00189F9D22|nr:UMP-CMP kinase 2, mitochondrial isoform X2 [Choloepus didactylus]
MAFARRPLPARLLLRRLSGQLRQRRGACAGAMAADRCFALELPDCSLTYFTLCVDPPGNADPPGGTCRDPGLAALLGPPGRSYSVCVPVAPEAGCGARVRSAKLHQRLLRQLRRGPLQQCQLTRLLSYRPGGQPGSAQHGFLLRDPEDRPDTGRALDELLEACKEAPRPHLGEFETDPHGRLWQRLWALQDGRRLQVGCARVMPVQEPALHPVLPDLPSSVVFPDREAAREVLEACISFIPEARAVLDLIDQCPKQVQKGKFPVIVIEGLDATVSDSLNAVLLKSPPSCIGQWRKIFDDEPSIIRRAFYSLGNYIVASEIAKESTHSPVIVDRYWHSTAAYAIATEISGGLQHLPPAHHDIFQWPKDLLKPDFVLLLTVSPVERMKRIEGRGMEKSEEEAELEANNVFRQKVEVSYQRMENPRCHVVDASPSRENVLQTVLNLIRNNCN